MRVAAPAMVAAMVASPMEDMVPNPMADMVPSPMGPRLLIPAMEPSLPTQLATVAAMVSPTVHNRMALSHLMDPMEDSPLMEVMALPS
ncbi:unnamed protein product, partial [Cylicostephanus goldi]